MATLMIPTALRAFTERKSRVEVTGATVGQLMDALAAQYPDLKQHIFEDGGALRSYINIFVGDTNVKSLQGLDTTVAADTQVMLVPAIAGGAEVR